MPRICIVIHANSEWNEQGLWQGQCDTRLSAAGVRMARQLAGRADLSDIQRIYSSDLWRAVGTALPLEEKLGLPVIQESGLREGRWADYVRDPDVPLLAADYGFESREDLTVRAIGALSRIARSCPESPVLIVTHGTFLECFINRIFPDAGNRHPAVRTAINRFFFEEGVWSIECLSDYRHLPVVEPNMICNTTKQSAAPGAG